MNKQKSFTPLEISGKKISKIRKKKFLTGFTLIDVLVGTFLILIVFLGIFGAYQLGVRVVGQSKNKIIATEIANGEIEKIRNLPYGSVGRAGGFPDGVLEDSKTVTNNIDFTVQTRVDYVVDPADGISMPEDDCPNDYKKVEVKVSWSGILAGEVKLVTDVAPINLTQECAETGGILLVSVFDAFGIMVPSPLIEIKNPGTEAVIKNATPIEGRHFFSLPANTYKVVVFKSGYSAERSYGIDEIATPEKPHPIVLEGQLTENSFSIDKVSSLTIKTRGNKGAGYPPIHNVAFNLRGAKLIGIDSEENPVYKYSQNQTTNGPGEILISNLEWDSYVFSVINPDLDLIGVESSPDTEIELPLKLAPDSSQTARLILTAENSLLITVQDIDTTDPIFSAAVRLYNGSDYDVTQYTNEEGKTYFIPLGSGIYTIEVQAPGYLDYFWLTAVFGDETEIINLQQVE